MVSSLRLAFLKHCRSLLTCVTMMSRSNRVQVQHSWSQRQPSGVGQVLRFQQEDSWSGGWHSLRGPGRWFWQCCLPVPQPGSETAALQEAHWPDSCTPHLLTSPSALCTHSAVLTIEVKTREVTNPLTTNHGLRNWRQPFKFLFASSHKKTAHKDTYITL